MQTNMGGLDLNLLVVFAAVMDEKNVTRASERLGKSQPATSNALNRLRHLLGDQLFVPGPHGMQPTPRALEIATPVRNALEDLQNTLQQSEFQPDQSPHTFTVAMSWCASAVLFPEVIKRTSRTLVDVITVPKVYATIREELASGRVDFAVGATFETPWRFMSKELFSETYCCLMSEHHPLKDCLNYENFLSASHLVVRSFGDGGNLFEHQLRAKGHYRRIAASVTQLSAVAPMLRQSDMIFSVQRRTMDTLGALDGLVVRKLPIDVDPVRVSLVWDEARTRNAPNKWMRGIFLDIARKLPPPVHRPELDG
ncbi:MAG TPA: LysR family transcriptional regulator [Devosiaceae bacterium]|jgi:DNA-binding transcriptional LysR family regulator